MADKNPTMAHVARAQIARALLHAFASVGMPVVGQDKPRGVSLKAFWPMIGSEKNKPRAKTLRNQRRAKRKAFAKIEARLRKAKVIK